MDINLLLQDHQVASMNADRTPIGSDQAALADLTGHHGARITAWREALDLPSTGWPRDERADGADNDQ